MNCIRCAKETTENNIFCDECLKDMERHPVKPETVIQLPNRKNRTVAKKSAFQTTAFRWKNQVFRLKYIIVILSVLCVILLLGLVMFASLVFGTAPAWLSDFFRSATEKAGFDTVLQEMFHVKHF